MANDLNKVQLIGRTGDDIKLHYFDDKSCIGRVSLATNSSYTNKSTNEKVEETEWHNLVFRNKAAELVDKYVKKGNQIYIEGRLKTRKWTDDNGVNRYSTEIHVTNMQFLSGATSSNASSSQQSASSNTSQSQSVAPEEDDDLPF